MNVVIDGTSCPVILAAAEPLVLHPRYHAMRVEVLEPEVGIYLLVPVCETDRGRWNGDGVGIVVAWVGDVMDQVDVDLLIALDSEAAGH